MLQRGGGLRKYALVGINHKPVKKQERQVLGAEPKRALLSCGGRFGQEFQLVPRSK